MIRRATEADLAAIQAIEQGSFPAVWAAAAFAAELALPHARVDVLVEDDRIVGFASYWLVVPGAQHAAEVHILSIATHPTARRRGVAAQLLAHALGAGRAIGATLATLEVRRSNAAAIALYARHGFATAHVRKRYYQDNDEDGLVMLASL